MNNLNITKQVPLIPLATLNGVLEAQGIVGFQPKDKALAIAKVIELINAGSVTIDQVKATKPSATVGLPTDVAEQISKAQDQINEALKNVETIRKTADLSLDSAFQQAVKIEKEFKILTDRLNAKVDAVEKPDAKLVADTLRDEVS